MPYSLLWFFWCLLVILDATENLKSRWSSEIVAQDLFQLGTELGQRFTEMGQKRQNMPFWCFWPISANLWPIFYTPLESVKFFWLFKTLKIKIHFFSRKFFKGSPLWILGFLEPTFLQMRQPILILDQNCFITWSRFCD